MNKLSKELNASEQQIKKGNCYSQKEVNKLFDLITPENIYKSQDYPSVGNEVW